jgi:primosomal protein N' (replication factor Y) (superfamily II helicase)
MTFKKYVSVILDLSLDKTLDYGVPDPFISSIKRGMRIEFPVRGHTRKGYIYEIKDHSDFSKVLPISKLISTEEMVTEELFELAIWMAKYYCASLSHVLKILLPSSVRKEMQHKQQLFVMRAKTREQLQELCKELRQKSPAQADVLDVMLLVKKGILLSELLEETGGSRSPVDSLVKKGYLSVDIVRIDRSPLINEEYFQTKPKPLNAEQASAFTKIVSSLDSNQFDVHLLYGITGSGKTEVYLQSIDKALKQDKGTIMLVPEISLTAQTIERFRSRFEGKIAILHHRLSHGERFDEWHKIRNGEAKIVIGARSAIFSPVVNLGLIIVDEEHESSYKQTEESPCYHARDVAVMRGKLQQCSVILGSATPSLESYYNAKKGKYILNHLSKRAESAVLPQVTIVDMKREFERSKGFTNFSESLLEGIKKRQGAGEQTILFLNRRGYHSTLFCQECRQPVKCNHCDISLTFHLGDNTLACHLCGFAHTPPPQKCPSCQSLNPMKFKGVGTELIEKSLHAIFPDIRTIRVDADTTRHKGSHQKLLRDFGTGKADVLIGTQMIAKGLHFSEVTLVGVLNCDSALNIPDFRASETAFQLLTQVAGRAGRGALKGEVILQTCMPDNRTIELAAQQNFEQFYEEEISSRKMFNYPPLNNMIKIAFSSLDEENARQTAEQFHQTLLAQLPSDYELNAVIPAGYAKVKDQFRFHFFCRGPSVYVMNRRIEEIKQIFEKNKKVKIFVDVNPLSTFF